MLQNDSTFSIVKAPTGGNLPDCGQYFDSLATAIYFFILPFSPVPFMLAVPLVCHLLPNPIGSFVPKAVPSFTLISLILKLLD